MHLSHIIQPGLFSVLSKTLSCRSLQPKNTNNTSVEGA